MINLPPDSWDLFSPRVTDTPRGWIARFLGSSPLIFCRLTEPEFRREMSRKVTDSLLMVAISHEVLHLRDVMSLLPLQAYYWAWLSSFDRLYKFISGTKGNELVIDTTPSFRSWIPPSPLSVAIRPGKVTTVYEPVLEGLALSQQLGDPLLTRVEKAALLDSLLWEGQSQEYRKIHLGGLEILSNLEDRLREKEIHFKIVDILCFMNCFHMFDKQHLLNLTHYFEPSPILPGEAMSICEHILRGGLVSLGALLRKPELLRKFLPRRDGLVRVLANIQELRVQYFQRCAQVSREACRIPRTAFLVSLALYSMTIFRFVSGKDWGECRQFFLREGAYSVPVIFSDGRVLDVCSNGQRRFCRLPLFWEGWLEFAMTKEVVRWIAEGDELCCPFYRSFLNSFGKDGMSGLNKFCRGFVFDNVRRSLVVSPRRSYCVYAGPELNIQRLARREGDLCFFWRSVLSNFARFKKVKLEPD